MCSLTVICAILVRVTNVHVFISLALLTPVPGWVLPTNRLMGMCRWMGSHFHDWIDYNGVAFSIGANRVTRMGSHICWISGVSKFRQVGIWGIFAQK